jgi:hypothetical protein
MTKILDASDSSVDNGEVPAAKTGRFTLRELFILMGLICIAGACYSWIGAAPVIAVLLFTLSTLVSIGFAMWILTRWSLVVGFISIIALILLLLPPIQGPPDGGGRAGSCANNLRNIALALQQYESVNGSFPPAYIADANGNPMHSWRVLLLPYLELKNLYNLYHFDEPWDGPNNSQLHGTRVRLFTCPSDIMSRTNTSYVVVTGPKTMWPGAKTTKMSDLKDGAANTIMLVEVHNSGIHWMEPRDLDIAQMSLVINSPAVPSISSGHSGGFAHVVMASGQTKKLKDNTSPKALTAALTIAGGEKERLP